MILISHRGNLSGRCVELENSQEYIDAAISKGYDVEVDVWEKNGNLYLGHDRPERLVLLSWLIARADKLWVHCKNVPAMEKLMSTPLHVFWHENDTMTLTSRGIPWVYPGKQPVVRSIAVLPEVSSESISSCLGICSDIVETYHLGMMYKDVEIVIQGNVEPDAYEFYLANYQKYKVVISTWEDCPIDFSKHGPNITIVKSKKPSETVYQNFNCQLISTLNGLAQVKSKFVMKMRGDEWYSNIDDILAMSQGSPDKIICSPIFFRRTPLYHMSDHIIAGKTDNLMLMFSEASRNFEKLKTTTWKTTPAEVKLATSYLSRVTGKQLSEFDGSVPKASKYMKTYFDVFKIKGHENYRIRYNSAKRVWNNDFDPKKENSIDNINDYDKAI